MGLLETLQADIIEILADRIGSYTYDGGESEPAIAILPKPGYGYSYPPSEIEVRGIEVTIIDEFNIEPRQHNKGSVDKITYKINMKNRNNGDGDLKLCSNLLRCELRPRGYVLEKPIFIPESEELGIPAQCVIPLIFYEWI